MCSESTRQTLPEHALIWARRLAIAGLLLGLSGCASLGYYWQSVSGHLELMRAARPVDVWLADPQTSASLRAKLELAQRIRAFASSTLHLPDNASYRSYAEIGRSAVVWNVVAAPELSLELETWCFPVAGCVSYRGYFSEVEARAEASRLRQQGMEVSVDPVPAYSTLGWMNWAGGDPLLSSFVNYNEDDLARLLFHELAHQLVYVRDDTMFNESFATAVERIGARQWRASRGLPAEPEDVALRRARRADFRALAEQTRQQLRGLYAAHQAGTISIDRARAAKRELMDGLRERYQTVRERWLVSAAQHGSADAAALASSLAGYDRRVLETNNATLAAMASYEELVPAFERLFERENGHWPRFFDAARILSSLPKQQRREALESIRKEAKGG